MVAAAVLMTEDIREENNSHRNLLDNRGTEQLSFPSLLNRNGTPPPYKRFPSLGSQQ